MTLLADVGLQPYGLSRKCYTVECVATDEKFTSRYIAQPSSNPLPLPSKKTGQGYEDVISKANNIFERNPVVAMLLIDKGEIIYERYNSEVNDSTLLLGYSMSKSVTSLVMGKAYCSGLVPDLNRTAQTYNAELKGSAYGEATVQQLLMMASGGPRGSFKNGGSPDYATLGNPLDTGYSDVILQLKNWGAQQAYPGEEFSYKNLDTQALGLVIGGQGRPEFFKVFNEMLWPDIKSEGSAFWVHDKNGLTHTPSSFHASLRDWGRIALHVLKQVKTNKDDCYSRYVKAATSTQIKNKSKEFGDAFWIGRAFEGYGYQFWTENQSDRDSIYMIGYLGQRIAINPQKERIMVVLSYREDYMGQLYRLFGSWK
jgi:CubicO group peptidase (beta-lactamase class C family)